MPGLTIAHVWASFAARIIPPDASPAQFDDMETAFYAGALAVLSYIESLGEAPSETIALALMHELHAEIHAFADARKRAGATHNGMTR